jgi:hypothetical protein
VIDFADQHNGSPGFGQLVRQLTNHLLEALVVLLMMRIIRITGFQLQLFLIENAWRYTALKNPLYG